MSMLIKTNRAFMCYLAVTGIVLCLATSACRQQQGTVQTSADSMAVDSALRALAVYDALVNNAGKELLQQHLAVRREYLLVGLQQELGNQVALAVPQMVRDVRWCAGVEHIDISQEWVDRYWESVGMQPICGGGSETSCTAGCVETLEMCGGTDAPPTPDCLNWQGLDECQLQCQEEQASSGVAEVPACPLSPIEISLASWKASCGF
jgi:hypothetical protein